MLQPMTETDYGFGEDGGRVPIVQFDYGAVEPAVEEPGLGGLSAAELEGAMRGFQALVRWVWQDGMRNPNGLLIRAIIVCWIFLPELRGHSLTAVARGFGRYKQSLGRWHDRFKVEFPTVKTVHMRRPGGRDE
jgi:hypothetical protein